MRLPSVDAAFNTAFSWLMLRLLGGPRRVSVPDWRARPCRILFIRDDGIGDLMVTMEVLRAITEVSPTIRLDLLCSPSNAAFARTLPFVNEVIVHRRGFLLSAWPTWRQLRANRYDVVIDGRVAIRNVNKQTTMLLLASGAPIRIGVAGRRNDRVYSLPIHLPEIRHWVDAHVALASPFGIAPDSRDWRARLTLTADQRREAEAIWAGVGPGRPRVLLNPFSASADRQWPMDRFPPVLAHLRARLPHATVIIPMMPAGDAEAERLAASGAGKALPLTLPQVTAVTATADLVISPDTAITVIASAFRVPVLALMRKHTEQWAPYRVEGRVAFSDDPRSLHGLPAQRVLDALDDVIAELGPGRGWTVSP